MRAPKKHDPAGGSAQGLCRCKEGSGACAPARHETHGSDSRSNEGIELQPRVREGVGRPSGGRFGCRRLGTRTAPLQRNCRGPAGGSEILAYLGLGLHNGRLEAFRGLRCGENGCRSPRRAAVGSPAPEGGGENNDGQSSFHGSFPSAVCLEVSGTPAAFPIPRMGGGQAIEASHGGHVSKPRGWADCQRQASAHIASSSRRALHPSKCRASVGSA